VKIPRRELGDKLLVALVVGLEFTAGEMEFQELLAKPMTSEDKPHAKAQRRKEKGSDFAP
jgi:hypothetical protein